MDIDESEESDSEEEVEELSKKERQINCLKHQKRL